MSANVVAAVRGLGVVAILAMGLLAAGAGQAAGPQSVAPLVKRLSPAVVNISTRQLAGSPKSARPKGENPDNFPFKDFYEKYFGKKPNKKRRRRRGGSSLGSGFVVDPSGIIVTNNHVIEGADEIVVNFPDGTRLKAKVRGHDPKTDLAVLKVEPKAPLAYVRFGDSDAIEVGDWVMAIGNPYGFSGTVTLGIVSARNRNINQGPYDDFIQTDAAINKGNSGGPLFNMDGEVVGINTAILAPFGGSIGIGFAVPANTARSVIDQLRKFGETRRGWLGVQITPVAPAQVRQLGLDRPRGALVADVTPTGPAEKAGIQPGDVVVKFNGVAVDKMHDLPRIVAATPVGKTVDVVVVRKGREKTIRVTLGRLEEGEKLVRKAARESLKVQTGEALEMSLSTMTPALRSQFKLPKAIKGVVVTKVKPGSEAARKRIQPGAVIIEAGNTQVETPDQVMQRVKQLKRAGEPILTVLVRDADTGNTRFLALSLE